MNQIFEHFTNSFKSMEFVTSTIKLQSNVETDPHGEQFENKEELKDNHTISVKYKEK